jgi:hypothetical protein
MTDIRQGRGKPAWVGTWTRPDIAFRVGKLSQVTEATLSEETVQDLNRLISHLLATPDMSLKFPKMDFDSIYIAAYGDASLGGNEDLSSQIGGIVTLRDGTDNCHLIH